MNNTCAKCGSDQIIPSATVIDHAGSGGRRELEIQVSADPGAMFFTGDVRSAVHARVCAGCGHVEFYADAKDGLWEAYQASLKQ
jgi:hypothetical protein